MTARYLLRMDDACQTMDHHKWQMLENLLDDFGIKPLVAIVPDNRDTALHVGSVDPMFWGRARCWQAKGWTIAMHGYQHVMHHTRNKSILPYYERSEFTGLSYKEQAAKIRRSWSFFLAQGVKPTVWIAPAHCFDRLTLQAIRDETPIRIVSDGIAREQYHEHGFFWIPQQLWSLTEKRAGLWTVCLHPNTMSERDLTALRGVIKHQYLNRIIAVDDVLLTKRRRSLVDRMDAFYFWQRHRAFKIIRKTRSIFHA